MENEVSAPKRTTQNQAQLRNCKNDRLSPSDFFEKSVVFCWFLLRYIMYFYLFLNKQFVKQYPYRGNLNSSKKNRIFLFIVVCLFAIVSSYTAEQFLNPDVVKMDVQRVTLLLRNKILTFHVNKIKINKNLKLWNNLNF